MKVTRISREFPANWLGFVFGRIGSKGLMIVLIGFFAFGTAQAQSTSDWVGNRQLVDGNDAIVKLKQAARQIIQQNNPQQQAPNSTAVAQGQGTDFSFINRVIEEIAVNGKSSRDAINTVALSAASEGMPITEITRVTQAIIAILS